MALNKTAEDDGAPPPSTHYCEAVMPRHTHKDSAGCTPALAAVTWVTQSHNIL